MFSLRFTCVLFLVKLCKARICLLFAFIIFKRERDRQFVFFISFSVACKFFVKSQDSKFPRNSNCTKIEYKSYKKDTKKPAKKVVKKKAAAKPAAKKTTTKKAAPKKKVATKAKKPAAKKTPKKTAPKKVVKKTVKRKSPKKKTTKK